MLLLLGRCRALLFEPQADPGPEHSVSSDSGAECQATNELLKILDTAFAAMDTPPCTFPGEAGTGIVPIVSRELV